MLTSTASPRDISLERLKDSPLPLLAWTTCLSTCAVLIGVIDYIADPIRTREPLVHMFVDSFWPDLSRQFMGLFPGHSGESLAGETSSSEWTYCLLVPFIVLWLVWRLWPRLRAAPAPGSPAGYWILGLGFLGYLVGFLTESSYIGIGSMQLIYAGLVVLFLGWPIMRLLFFPWAFLLFMWPYDILEEPALQLRLLMAWLSHLVLRIADVPNQLQGTAILSPPDAPHPFALDVADPCSGIRSLFALIMIAAIYSFLALRLWWQQVVVVALAIPLAILGNLVRLVLLAVATIHLGQAFAIGTDNSPSWFHEGVGYLVYFINLGGLLLVGWLLSRSSPTVEGVPASAPRSRLAETSNPLARKIVFVLAILIPTVVIGLLTPPPRQAQPGVVVDLPDVVGPLLGHPQEITPAELTILAPDTTFARKSYGPPGGDPFERILCTIVQSGATPRSLHRPERCLPSQGYVVDGSQICTIPLQSGHHLDTRLFHLSHGYWQGGRRVTVKSDFIYWYVADGVATPFRFDKFIITHRDLLFRHLNQRWSYVYVMGNILQGLEPNGRNEAETLSLLENFIRASVPYFMRSEMTSASGI